jgi:hypothetical protein
MDLDDILVRLRHCLFQAERLPDVWSHLNTARYAVERAKEELERHVALCEVCGTRHAPGGNTLCGR